MNKIALVTGASSGIGRAVSVALAKEGYNLIITGRRAAKLTELSACLRRDYSVRILELSFDVRDLSAVNKNLGSLPEEWCNINLLVNNAGLAVGLNSVDQGVTDDWDRMIDTNVKGLLYVTRIVSVNMVKRGSGHIINIGSIAGKEVYPNGNVYCATKHAVDALSKAMLTDLYMHNIKVSQICPGAVETEFSEVRFKGDTKRASEVYKGFTPLKAEDVAEVVRYVATAPDHVNISDVVVMPSAQASASFIKREQGL